MTRRNHGYFFLILKSCCENRDHYRPWHMITNQGKTLLLPVKIKLLSIYIFLAVIWWQYYFTKMFSPLGSSSTSRRSDLICMARWSCISWWSRVERHFGVKTGILGKGTSGMHGYVLLVILLCIYNLWIYFSSLVLFWKYKRYIEVLH